MTGKSTSGSRQPLRDRYEAKSALGLADDLKQREARINCLPAIEKELAQETSRFGDLCQFFQEKRIDVPHGVVEQLTRVAALAIPKRIQVMKKLNRSLMEYLHDVDSGTRIRQ